MRVRPSDRPIRTSMLIAITFLVAISACAVVWQATNASFRTYQNGDYMRLTEAVVLYATFSWLMFSLLVAVCTEWGEKFRTSAGNELNSSARIRKAHSGGPPSKLLILIPSYREEPGTIWQTLMSAALVEHRGRDVVLLIDDPDPAPTSDQERLLRSARALPHKLQILFNEANDFLQGELKLFGQRRHSRIDVGAELGRLANLYVHSAEWLSAQANQFCADRGEALSPTDQLFLEKILLNPSNHHRAHAKSLVGLLSSVEDIEAEYLRLAGLFSVRFFSFERKRYENLSHAPNKAMNVNSYIGLIGGAYREHQASDGLRLEPCDVAQASLIVPPYEFIVVVDADSLITSDYAVRLIEVMTAPENARVAIAQSPYTAIPNALSRIERAASASTDAQYFSHQGLASFDASSWVGASALIRHEALLDIATERMERGYQIKVFIKDDILIEDAAATIDLIKRGWKIFHDDRRLSYSATPSDFGSLIVQRQRWANGGLLILPRLLAYALCRPWSWSRMRSTLVRTPNLASAATNGILFCLLLFIPFDDGIVPIWMAGIMLPSLLLTGYAVLRAGYRWTDLFAVLALNFLLVPVNLAGTIQSLHQAATGRHIPFARTPKVAGRTPARRLYILWVYAIIFYAIVASILDLSLGRYSHGVFAIMNAFILSFCLVNFIGLRNSLVDLGILPGSAAGRLIPGMGKTMNTPARAAPARSRWIEMGER